MVRFHQIVILYETLLPSTPTIIGVSSTTAVYPPLNNSDLHPKNTPTFLPYLSILDEDLLRSNPALLKIRDSSLLKRALLAHKADLGGFLLTHSHDVWLHRLCDELFKLHAFEFEFYQFSHTTFLYFNTPLRNIPPKEVFLHELEFLPYHPVTPILSEIQGMRCFNSIMFLSKRFVEDNFFLFFFHKLFYHLSMYNAVLSSKKLNYFHTYHENFLNKNFNHFSNNFANFFVKKTQKNSWEGFLHVNNDHSNTLPVALLDSYRTTINGFFSDTLKSNMNLFFFDNFIDNGLSLVQKRYVSLLENIFSSKLIFKYQQIFFKTLKQYLFGLFCRFLYLQRHFKTSHLHVTVFNIRNSKRTSLVPQFTTQQNFFTFLDFFWLNLFVENLQNLLHYGVKQNNCMIIDRLKYQVRCFLKKIIKKKKKFNYCLSLYNHVSQRITPLHCARFNSHKHYSFQTYPRRPLHLLYYVYTACFIGFSYRTPSLYDTISTTNILWKFLEGSNHYSSWLRHVKNWMQSCFLSPNEFSSLLFFKRFRCIYVQFVLNMTEGLTSDTVGKYPTFLSVFSRNSLISRISTSKNLQKSSEIQKNTPNRKVVLKKWKLFRQKFGFFNDKYFWKKKNILKSPVYMLTKELKSKYDIKKPKLSWLSNYQKKHQTCKFTFLFLNTPRNTLFSACHFYTFFLPTYLQIKTYNSYKHEIYSTILYKQSYTFKYYFFTYISNLLVDSEFLFIKITRVARQLGLTSPHPYKIKNDLSFLKQFCNTSRAWSMLWWLSVKNFVERDLYHFEKTQQKNSLKPLYLSRFLTPSDHKTSIKDSDLTVFHLEKNYYFHDIINFNLTKNKTERILYKNFFDAISWNVSHLDNYEPIVINLCKSFNFSTFFYKILFNSKGLLMGLRNIQKPHYLYTNLRWKTFEVNRILTEERKNEIYSLKKRYLKKVYNEVFFEKNFYKDQKKLLNQINQLFYDNRNRLLIKSEKPSEWQIQTTSPNKNDNKTFLTFHLNGNKNNKKFIIFKDESLPKNITLMRKLIKKYNKQQDKQKELFQFTLKKRILDDLNLAIEKKLTNTTKRHVLYIEALKDLYNEDVDAETWNVSTYIDDTSKTMYVKKL